MPDRKRGGKRVIILYDRKKTIETVREHDFSFRKKFGQNFLTDHLVLSRIIEAADLSKDDCVVEIGPGIGTLTGPLAEAAGTVVAVEIDRMLIPILKETLAGYDNVVVINQDILKTDLKEIAGQYHGGRPLKIVANLPYYITTPIIMGLFEQHVPVETVTVMVQKEVAMRMQASPGSKDYGALSLAVQYYADVRIAANVPPNCFVPRPKVGSAVVHLDCGGGPRVQVRDEKLFFGIIRAAFNQRRKTLANALRNAPQLSLEREQVTEALKEMGLPETVRGEAMTLGEFARFSECVSCSGNHYLPL